MRIKVGGEPVGKKVGEGCRSWSGIWTGNGVNRFLIDYTPVRNCTKFTKQENLGVLAYVRERPTI